MQLYMVASQIKWIDVSRFKNIILRPGIMHTIQSVCGAIGMLNKGTGLDVLIKSAFGGLTGIFSGKNWVNLVRAFRMVMVSLLQKFLLSGHKTFDELCLYLENCRAHPTGKHWVDNFIVPTMLLHHLIRAEREGDFDFQQLALSRLLPYLFVSGHFNYARYLT